MAGTTLHATNSENPDAVHSTRVVHIPLDLISPGDFQARREFAQAALTELAQSIAESGVIQPVVVRGRRQSGYTLLAGERRWRAAARAGLQEVPAVIRNDLGEDQAAILGLIENLQRESLSLLDTARGLQNLSNGHNLTHDMIAARIGKSRVYVTNYLRVLQLAAPVQELLQRGQLSLGHAKILAGVDMPRQLQLARTAADRNLSVRALERLARKAVPANTTPAACDNNGKDTDLADLEQRLSTHLGNAVHIRYRPDTRCGQLRIDFHDLDEFEGLLAQMGFNAAK